MLLAAEDLRFLSWAVIEAATQPSGARLTRSRLLSQTNWASASAGFLKCCTRSSADRMFLLSLRNKVDLL